MKTLITLLLLLAASTHVFAKSLNEERINTTEGYPYKHVILKADRVELKYSDNGRSVECRVIVTKDGKHHEGQRQFVTSKKFNKEPMAACLTRSVAKRLLAKL